MTQDTHKHVNRGFNFSVSESQGRMDKMEENSHGEAACARTAMIRKAIDCRRSKDAILAFMKVSRPADIPRPGRTR